MFFPLQKRIAANLVVARSRRSICPDIFRIIHNFSQRGQLSVPQLCQKNSNCVAAHPTRQSSSHLRTAVDTTGNHGFNRTQHSSHDQDDNLIDNDDTNNDPPFISEGNEGCATIQIFVDCGNYTEDGPEYGPVSSMLSSHKDHVDSMRDGSNLSLFSVEEQAHLDLLQTLGQLGAPMKSYDAIMQWKNPSIRNGYIFRNEAISS